MEYKTITIISEIDGDMQAWTFDIKEADLSELMEKYDGRGCSVLGDASDICGEILDIYNK